MSKLELVFVDMILNEKEESGEKAFSNKTSSSYIRQYLDEKTGFKAKELYKRFYELCNKVQLPEEQRLKWWTTIRDSYSTHWRYYFNLNHIYQILEKFDQFYDTEIYPEESKIFIELAIWFHRIVFIPQIIDSTHNVKESYNILKQFVEETQYNVVTSEQLSFLQSLVLSVNRHRQTEVYDNKEQDSLNKFFLDIILSFLGFENEIYKRFASLVKKEYLWVEKSEFKLKRRIILQRLLDRERIFITNEIYNKFEEQARQNLQNEVDETEESK